MGYHATLLCQAVAKRAPQLVGGAPPSLLDLSQSTPWETVVESPGAESLDLDLFRVWSLGESANTFQTEGPS